MGNFVIVLQRLAREEKMAIYFDIFLQKMFWEFVNFVVSNIVVVVVHLATNYPQAVKSNTPSPPPYKSPSNLYISFTYISLTENGGENSHHT